MKLRQSTAGQEVPIGPFLDSTDANTEKTALTILNTDVKLWKEGATSLVNKNTGSATYMSNGVYYTVLDATDTNTVGALFLFIHATGSLYVKSEFEVLPAAVYDANFGSSYLPVNLVQITGSNVNPNVAQLGVNVVNVGGTVQTAGDIIADTNDIQSRLPAALVSGRIDASVGAMQTDVITSTSLAASAVTEIQTGLSTLDAAGVRTAVGLASANLDTQLDALPTATENADALLKRDWNSVTGEASRSVLNALRFIRNKFSTSVTPGSVTIYKEDDTTVAYTKTVTTDATANPIVEG